MLSFELPSLLNASIMVWYLNFDFFTISLYRFDASLTKYGFQNTFLGGNDFSTSTAKQLSFSDNQILARELLNSLI